MHLPSVGVSRVHARMQDAMGRVAVDTFLAASGFGTDLKALDFQPCPPMELLHYATYEALAGSLPPKLHALSSALHVAVLHKQQLS